jgi:predicted ribosomally synthesized peptide with nif11-like leader
MGEIGKYSDAGENQQNESEKFKEIRPIENLPVEEVKKYWDEKFSEEEVVPKNDMHEEGKTEKHIEKVIPCGMMQFLETCDRNEITKEQIAKAMQCKSAEELIAFAKSEGIDITKEEAEAYLAEMNDVELDEEALKKVAGGNYVSCPIHCLTDCPRYGKGANCRRYGNT